MNETLLSVAVLIGTFFGAAITTPIIQYVMSKRNDKKLAAHSKNVADAQQVREASLESRLAGKFTAELERKAAEQDAQIGQLIIENSTLKVENTELLKRLDQMEIDSKQRSADNAKKIADLESEIAKNQGLQEENISLKKQVGEMHEEIGKLNKRVTEFEIQKRIWEETSKAREDVISAFFSRFTFVTSVREHDAAKEAAA